MKKQRFRKLTAEERQFLDRLLELPFPGRDELRLQANAATAREIAEDGDNYGSLKLRAIATPRAAVVQRVPVMALANDVDEVPIEFLLHVVDGVLDELEILKLDGSPIVNRPKPLDLRVRAHGPGDIHASYQR